MKKLRMEFYEKIDRSGIEAPLDSFAYSVFL